jgi:NAD(P)-dependent dehydrogenase (short-subunit alcohol dehydrogenase family)
MYALLAAAAAVAAFAAALLQPHKHVDCGLELNIAANYWGPFYLTQLLLDDLKASAPSRWVASRRCAGSSASNSHVGAGGWSAVCCLLSSLVKHWCSGLSATLCRSLDSLCVTLTAGVHTAAAAAAAAAAVAAGWSTWVQLVR